MILYKHTQTGHVIIACMLIGCTVVLALNIALGKAGQLMPVGTLLAILVLCMLLFSTMTIEIRDGRLRWSFGPGLIRKSVALADITGAELWKMRGIGAWGIHWGPQGWLYNVSGRRGVVVVLKSGKQFILGTDEPERLLAAIRSAIASQGREPRP